METTKESINNNRHVKKQNKPKTADIFKLPEVVFCDNQINKENVNSNLSVGVVLPDKKRKSTLNHIYNTNSSNTATVLIRKINRNTISNMDEPIDLTFTSTEDKLEISKCLNSVDQEITINNEKQLEKESLPSTSLISSHAVEIMKNDYDMNFHCFPKKRGRKRKTNSVNIDADIKLSLQDVDGNGGYFPNSDNKQAEVIKAVKSLFSKRTRTLYHWMYPNAPKQQLKAAVAASWETLGPQEKEFYVSQVLGRFGFPQCSLMVNPQLGGITGIPSLSALNISNPFSQSNDETKFAVSSILLGDSSDDSGWSANSTQINLCQASRGQKDNKKKKRLGRPPGSKNKKQHKDDGLKMMPEEVIVDEFKDDPELCREFEQFKWTLHLNDNK